MKIENVLELLLEARISIDITRPLRKIIFLKPEEETKDSNRNFI